METNSSQAVTATRTYDAFGMLVATTGSSSSPFGYVGAQGYQEDGDSGLKLLGHRYYDPSTGRFLTRDRVKDGRNWYGYCGNHPSKVIDPSGFNGADVNLYIAGYDDSGAYTPPVQPPGVDIETNIGIVRSKMNVLLTEYEDSWLNNLPGGGLVSGGNYIGAKLKWFKGMVENEGPWDFKSGPGNGQYEDYGNWHYGVVGKAAGMSEDLLLRAAGENQMTHNPGGPPWGGFGAPPGSGSSYGDDPRDQKMIKMGFDWWNIHHG